MPEIVKHRRILVKCDFLHQKDQKYILLLPGCSDTAVFTSLQEIFTLINELA